jgi:hypothetical protein
MSTYTPKSKWRKLWGPNTLAVLIIVVAMIVSLWQIMSYEQKSLSSTHKVIRLAHWQLELGVRDAMQGVMNRYNAMKEAEFKAGKIPARIEVVRSRKKFIPRSSIPT